MAHASASRRFPGGPVLAIALTMARAAGLAVLAVLWGCVPLVVDSDLTRDQAVYANQPPDVDWRVQAQLVVVSVRYWGFDGGLHQGQLVVHRALAADVRAVFEVIEHTHFPIESVLPIAHPLIQAKGPWGLSSDTGNTSAWVWRAITGHDYLSLHALGLAVDINPRLNPYIKGDLVIPAGSVHDPSRPGALTRDGPVVAAFRRLGWEWGGDWTEDGAGGRTDWMHFQKIPPELADWVRRTRGL
ncbi:MAG: M15 family metallopeptidase [Desulfovibrionaceae bacterium]